LSDMVKFIACEYSGKVTFAPVRRATRVTTKWIILFAQVCT